MLLILYFSAPIKEYGNKQEQETKKKTVPKICCAVTQID